MLLKLKHFCFIVCAVVLGSVSPSFSQEDLPYYLQDRGSGVPVSLFGTYINKGEIMLYPFYEYYYDQNAEYKPRELGYGLDEDFRGRYRAHEGLIFIGYGISDNWAAEMEAAVITATQYKSANDPSSMPVKLEESGLGDVQSELRWRWLHENTRRPEAFSYLEIVYPLQKKKALIGTQEWEFKFGTGATKGFQWGTVTLRLAAEITKDKVEPGEYALEYLKRVSKLFRFYVGVEGSEDEVEFITDAQFHITPRAFIRINNAFGITSKATDYAPEVGVVILFDN